MRERHIAADDQASSDLGAEAAKKALTDAGVKAEEVDLIIVATLSPDMFFPSTACFVQEKIGAKNAFCYDLGAACSGFLYALECAKNQIVAGAIDTALVIGAEKMSTFLDWEDRTTCVLFGDGAGAVVLQSRGDERGVMDAVMGSDGSLADLLCTPGCGSRNPATPAVLEQRMQYLKMQGRDVFKHAVARMGQSVIQTLEKNQILIDDIKCFIPHQANSRIIDAIGRRLGITDRIYLDVAKYANTSSAAVAIALDEAVNEGVIQKGDLFVMTVFGGGFTWGANVVEWCK